MFKKTSLKENVFRVLMLVILATGLILTPFKANAFFGGWGFGGWGSGGSNAEVGSWHTEPSADFPKGTYTDGDTFTISSNFPEVIYCSNAEHLEVTDIRITNDSGNSSISLIETKKTSKNIRWTYKVNKVVPNSLKINSTINYYYDGYYERDLEVGELLGTIKGTINLKVAKSPQAPLSITPTTPHEYGTIREFTVTGGSGTGAVTTRLHSGNARRVSNLRYRATSGTGSYKIEVTKAGNQNYNPRTQIFEIPLKKANQSALGITPQNPQKYDKVRDFTVTGGSVTGAVTTRLDSGNASRVSNLRYKALSGTGSYEIEVTKEGNQNYNPRTDTFEIPLKRANQSALTIDKETHKYDVTQTFEIGGGSGSGAESYVISSGSDKVENKGYLTYKALSGTGDYVISAKKDGDNNYKSIEQDFRIELKRAEQDDILVVPTNKQYYLEERTFNVTGGSSTGDFRDSLISGSAVREGDFTYKATAGDGNNYRFRVTREGDDNFLDKTKDVTIDLKSLKANPSLKKQITLTIDEEHLMPGEDEDEDEDVKKYKKEYNLEINFNFDNFDFDNFDFEDLEDGFSDSNFTIGKVELYKMEDDIDEDGKQEIKTGDLTISVPKEIGGAIIVPVTLSAEIQDGSPGIPQMFNLKLSEFSYENNGYVMSEDELSTQFLVFIHKVDVN